MAAGKPDLSSFSSASSRSKTLTVHKGQHKKHQPPCRCPCLKRSDASLATNAAYLWYSRQTHMGFLAVARVNLVLFHRGFRLQSSPCFAYHSAKECCQTCIALFCVHLHSRDPVLLKGFGRYGGSTVISLWRDPSLQLDPVGRKPRMISFRNHDDLPSPHGCACQTIPESHHNST